jgi:hypothetical protein
MAPLQHDVTAHCLRRVDREQGGVEDLQDGVALIDGHMLFTG